MESQCHILDHGSPLELTKHSIKQLCCKMCYAVSAIPEALTPQTKVCHNSFECQICGASFKDLGYLCWHVKNTHDATPKFQCKICSVIFKDPVHLSQHMKVHSGKKIFKCDVCSTSFSQDTKFVQHMNNHNVVKSLQSPIQDDVFHQKYHCNDRISEKLNTQEVHSRECAESCLPNTKKHDISGHADVERYKCENGHLNTPSSTKIFASNPSYCQKASIVLHRNVETVQIGKKIFICEICDKAFVSSYRLIRHKTSVHLGLKKFTCEKCSERFSQKYHLTRHIRNVHLGVKKFTCEKCSERFSQKYHLTRHIRNVHLRVKKFRTLCKEKFPGEI